MNTIVGVHGIGNYYPAGAQAGQAELSRRWTALIRRSLRQVAWPAPAAVDVEVAYWAHLVQEPQHPAVNSQSHVPDAVRQAASFVEGGGTFPVGASVLRAHVGERGELVREAEAPASGAEEDTAGGLLASVRDRLARGHSEDIAGLLRVAELREVVTRWEQLRGRDLKVRERVAMVAFDEVAHYLDSAECRRACAREVTEAIERYRPRVVVAHSLGSVAAYEALHQVRGTTVELFLTLGSPLGSPNSVMQVLDPAPVEGRGERPGCVRHWVNISDPGDVVPFVQDLAPSFAGVDADLHPVIGPRGSHDAARYLASATTAAVLVQHLAAG